MYDEAVYCCSAGFCLPAATSPSYTVDMIDPRLSCSHVKSDDRFKGGLVITNYMAFHLHPQVSSTDLLHFASSAACSNSQCCLLLLTTVALDEPPVD